MRQAARQVPPRAPFELDGAFGVARAAGLEPAAHSGRLQDRREVGLVDVDGAESARAVHWFCGARTRSAVSSEQTTAPTTPARAIRPWSPVSTRAATDGLIGCHRARGSSDPGPRAAAWSRTVRRTRADHQAEVAGTALHRSAELATGHLGGRFVRLVLASLVALMELARIAGQRRQLLVPHRADVDHEAGLERVVLHIGEDDARDETARRVRATAWRDRRRTPRRPPGGGRGRGRDGGRRASGRARRRAQLAQQAR